ncbi:MAG: PIN domain-containing protein [Candidatus Levybacteria bacterium]|nr:PIN domain-containing protein [Candidatus Levybacteria bacterium]
MNKKLLIFVDTDAFVAFVKEEDNTHERAKRILLQLRYQQVTFITSNYVFLESVTVISQKINHQAAVSYIDKMLSADNPYELRRIDKEIDEQAIELFKKQTSKNTSFVDCTNMAFMQKMDIDAIFSFDEVYRKNGLQLVEDIVY